MNPKVLKTDADYETALARVDELMSAKPGTPEGAELELWSVLVEEYERRTFPVELPGPIAAIQFRMEQEGLHEEDLVAILGSRRTVTEVLSGRRALSLEMIRRLHEELQIPAEILLNRPKLSSKSA